MAKTKTKTTHRDAGTGQYIPKEQAEKHPKTTVTEHDKIAPKKTPTKKK